MGTIKLVDEKREENPSKLVMDAMLLFRAGFWCGWLLSQGKCWSSQSMVCSS